MSRLMPWAICSLEGNSSRGTVRVYARKGEHFELEDILGSPDRSRFGIDMAIEGTRIVVGAYEASGGS